MLMRKGKKLFELLLLCVPLTLAACGKSEKPEPKKDVADVTEAPSNEAVNYITLLSHRERISPYEIEFARNTYGRNFACYAALQETAAKNGVFIENHPTREALDAIRSFEERNNDYTYETISNSEHSPEVTASLYAAGIDGDLFFAGE